MLETKRAGMHIMPTLDFEEVNAYLLSFLEILSKLERLGSGRIRASTGHIHDSQGNIVTGQQTAEEIEEEELVQWASLKQHQEAFVRKSGFVGQV